MLSAEDISCARSSGFSIPGCFTLPKHQAAAALALPSPHIIDLHRGSCVTWPPGWPRDEGDNWLGWVQLWSSREGEEDSWAAGRRRAASWPYFILMALIHSKSHQINATLFSTMWKKIRATNTLEIHYFCCNKKNKFRGKTFDILWILWLINFF